MIEFYCVADGKRILINTTNFDFNKLMPNSKTSYKDIFNPDDFKGSFDSIYSMFETFVMYQAYSLWEDNSDIGIFIRDLNIVFEFVKAVEKMKHIFDEIEFYSFNR